MRTKQQNKKSGKSKKLNKLLTAVGIVLCVIFIPLLIANLTIIIKSFVNPEEVPDFLGITPLVVMSGSMEDEIKTGDLVFVVDVNTASLKADASQGDIIAFKEQNGNAVITHRIIDIKTDEKGERVFVTKGDNNNTEDKAVVYSSQVVGIYKLRIPKLGEIAMLLQTPLGMFFFIATPLIVFIIYDLLRRNYYVKRERIKSSEMKAELIRLRKIAREAAIKEEDIKKLKVEN